MNIKGKYIKTPTQEKFNKVLDFITKNHESPEIVKGFWTYADWENYRELTCLCFKIDGKVFHSLSFSPEEYFKRNRTAYEEISYEEFFKDEIKEVKIKQYTILINEKEVSLIDSDKDCVSFSKEDFKKIIETLKENGLC